MNRILGGGLMGLAAVLLVGGCVDDEDDDEPAPPVPEWSAPLAVAPGGCPIESRDGSLLYTAAGAAGTSGLDIWALRRNAQTNTYDSRTKLGDPVSLDGTNDFCPTPLSGDYLMFVSNREAPLGGTRCADPAAPGLGGADIFVTRYAVGAPAAAGAPLQLQSNGPAQRLACHPDGPNNRGTKFSPSLLTTADGGFLFFSSDHDGTALTGNQDIYVSEMRPDGTYGPGVPVAAVNTTFEDQQPNVTRDGLTMVFASNRGGNMDIYITTRTSLSTAWSTPRNLSIELAFPTAALAETRPSISWDQQRLYYGSDGQAYLSHKAPAN
jgi:hypothetical protein